MNTGYFLKTKPRGRPKKQKIVHIKPKITQFSPRGKPGRPDEVELEIEEFEALRLADFQGKPQIEAAKSMAISQQTFSRILKKARKKTAEGLLLGKRISIRSSSVKPVKEVQEHVRLSSPVIHLSNP
ncbi:MAG: DUF134 domain-containing protein [Candidatus Omnitrophota bacterium]